MAGVYDADCNSTSGARYLSKKEKHALSIIKTKLVKMIWKVELMLAYALPACRYIISIRR